MNETRNCEACGATYARDPKWSRGYFARRRYCSQTCPARRRPMIAQNYEVDANGCHVWQGYIDRNGYGRAYDPTRPAGKRFDWAHRIAYRNVMGDIPARHEIDHVCQNTRCVNPAHLEAVTKVEHVRRTMERLGHHESQEEAVRLRIAGLTYAEIATVARLASRNAAHSRVSSAIRKGLVDPSDVPRPAHLADEDRDDIRALYALGVPQTELGAWYGVDSSQVSRICAGKRSGHA